MTNTIAFKQPVLGGLSLGRDLSVAATQRVKMSLRKVVAIALFVLAGFASVGSSFDLALAKVASKMRAVRNNGQFHLLSLYNSMKTTNPSLINAMNSASSGLASWYGGMFHGRKTAMGTTYNMYAMTAAHRSLPLGTWVRVTNERNGKSAIVQVTDRGPYVANRIMDLSYAAAQKLGYMSTGTTDISMSVIGTGYASAEEAAIIPTAFSRIWTRSANTVVNTDSSTDIFDAIASLATGSPAALFG